MLFNINKGSTLWITSFFPYSSLF